ncbi:homocysteine S-methyltransferase family protein [uncultured Desulfosarcina sp.]|uniref:homocysteine S-methyltransferase family protein n=1 Tax=uncultured Desulfosarcina sp. TaxID=218289 RepID=UPI0029C68E94|nr:homocysteine S-methyltransferase family protein [uncultured Desulfosarcina sp.]
MKKLIENNPLVLMEAAIVEQLRRSEKVQLHGLLANAPLIYDPVAAKVMGTIYKNYMEIALQAGLPMLVCTPTWRAGKDNVQQSGISDTINADAVCFMQGIRLDDSIKIGGLIGCKNDSYRPDEGLTVADAENFHAWQIGQLAKGGVDFLIAETLPNVHEALGIAKAMAATKIPYIISFVISRDGCVLDGTSLDAAIALIDTNTHIKPLGYMINCAHPSFLRPETQSSTIFSRLIGFLANASSLDHCDLENADELKVDSISEWGRLMLDLNRTYGVKILGGCCGTGVEHLKYLIPKSGVSPFSKNRAKP